MNQLLQLKGTFEQRSRPGGRGPQTLRKGALVTAKHLQKLYDDLDRMVKFWENEKLFSGALVSVYYVKLAAKSNRVSALLQGNKKSSDDTIVGARFAENDDDKHIITHYVSLDVLMQSMEILLKTKKIVEVEFGGELSRTVFNEKKNIKKINFNKFDISKSKFEDVIVDASYVEKIDVLYNAFDLKKESIVTIYETDKDIEVLLEDLGISVHGLRKIDNTTVLLDSDQIESILEKAPYLIAMGTEDISLLMPTDFKKSKDDGKIQIPSPTNEPTIGVIDTLFDDRVYFSEWVEYTKYVDEGIPTTPKDYSHGTAISSLIVDGPNLNPWLEDGCGRFKVKHFGVAVQGRFSSISIIRAIKDIVRNNKEIKVWNLSLGSNSEINDNFISVAGATLDQIQYDNDVIFVIAATNKNPNEGDKKIGSPADSINSMVVSSVDENGKPAGYSRKGIVLSFFTKPDVGYYGGTSSRCINVCEPNGLAQVSGTSFATPWIARKLSYLIDVLGFSREVAKALIIDSAIGWDNNKYLKHIQYLGHGIVPIHINDIIYSPKDEIKFVVSGISEKYDSYNYRFPVPIHKNEYPYIAKATLCYFPKCSRNQGVDYTNTELDLYFGRLKENTIKSLNNNKQSIDEEPGYITEKVARKGFRKWDNVKHIQDETKTRYMSRKSYDNKFWGMSVKTKERLTSRDGNGIKFGVVVTLKEINGVNRIEEFIQLCNLSGWLVNKVDVESRIEIYQKAEEKIEFE